MAGWVPDAPGTGGWSYTGVTAPFFAPPGNVPWRRHLHGYAAGWSHAGHLLHQELTRAQPRCCLMGTSLPRYLSLPTATAPWAKSGTRQPREVHGRGGGTQPVTAKGPRSSFLECCLMPVASTQPVPWGCAVYQGLCHAPELCRAQGLPYGTQAPTCARGSLGCWAGGWWPGWAAESEARWAQAGLSCCSWRRAAGACLLLRQPCQARGGTCPHRALAKVRQTKVHASGGPRVTQQCPVPRLAGRRHSIPRGLLGPVVQHVGAAETGSLAGTRPALHGPICASSGHISSSDTGSPALHSPGTHTRWILFTPGAGTVSSATPHSPCAGRCCLGSFELAELGAEPAALESCGEHGCAPGPGSTETSLSRMNSAFY